MQKKDLVACSDTLWLLKVNFANVCFRHHNPLATNQHVECLSEHATPGGVGGLPCTGLRKKLDESEGVSSSLFSVKARLL